MRRAARLSFAAIALAATAAAAQTPIPRGQISEWIARYHPNVFAGDPHVTAVTLVVDTNNKYVASVADSMASDVKAALDSVFAGLVANNAISKTAQDLVAGRLRVPGADGGRPVYIVDGVRLKNVDSLNASGITDVKMFMGADAASRYGSDAGKSGAVVVTTIHPDGWNALIQAAIRQRLMKLAIRPERVDLDNAQQMRVRPGLVGPNQMYVTVLQLKGGTEK